MRSSPGSPPGRSEADAAPDRLKILLVGDYPPPYGGVSVHVAQLHRLLRSNGVEAKVLDIGKGGRPAPDVIRGRTWAPYARELVAFAFGCWLLHLHTSGANAKSWAVAASVGRAGWLAGRRPLITLHSGRLPAFLEHDTRNRLWARWALQGFGAVVAVSPEVRDAVAPLVDATVELHTLPAFLGLTAKPGPPPAVVAAFRQHRSPVVSMAHHPSSVYGREVAFAALARLLSRWPDMGLIAFGPGAGDAAFQGDARRAGVSSAVLALGEVDHAVALATMAASDLFLRPTRVDGDALSVREALALGIRCVASDAASRPEGTFLFASGDAVDLFRAMELALASRYCAPPAPAVGSELLAMYRDAWARGGLSAGRRVSNLLCR